VTGDSARRTFMGRVLRTLRRRANRRREIHRGYRRVVMSALASANVSLLCVLLSCAVGVAQEKPTAPGDGKGKVGASARRRPEWKASLSLPADLWQDATKQTIGATAEWTNKVEIADVDGDRRPDLLFANGGDYDTPGAPVATRVFANRGGGKPFEEITKKVFGDATFLARVVKARDVDGDGKVDLFVGTTFGTQSRLWLGKGGGAFRDATATNLPALPLSVGDAEFGDIDGDGDLDLVLADWGTGSPMKNDGGRTRLFRNTNGVFADATADCMPDVAVKFCWELEFVDVDNDFDLDLLVSSKRSTGSFLFLNTNGRFVDVSAQRLPQFTNNYEFEAMDVNRDGFLDLVTINDGVGERRFCEHLFQNDKKGAFVDVTDAAWPAADNPQFDDNAVAFLDFDSDGDADFLIGSLDGPDRLLQNDGDGHFAAAAPVFAGDPTAGTLSLALADLDGDHRLDCVHAQGENQKAMAEKVFFGKGLAPDTGSPWIGTPTAAPGAGGTLVVRVRVHDHKSPCAPHDWQSVSVQWEQNGTPRIVPLTWYGEYLWRADLVELAKGPIEFFVIATDAAGNESRSVVARTEVR